MGPTVNATAGLQPFLHESVSCVSAPAVALSGQDGQIRSGGAHGVFRYERRVLSQLIVDVDGHEPVAVGHRLHEAGRATFVGVVRHVGDRIADPTVRLERERLSRPDGIDECLVLDNRSREAISVTVRVIASVDLAGVVDVKSGRDQDLLPAQRTGDGNLTWADEHTRVTLHGSGDPTVDSGSLTWQVTVPARASWTADLALTVADLLPLPNSFPAARNGPGWDSVVVDGSPELSQLVARGVGDIVALTLADPSEPEDVFVAGGSPWFFTLFGRDSIWAARLTLPLGTDLARGTLRTLARRQGTRHDPETAEAPGKILHEVRTTTAHSGLPPVYFGSVDATALWVCLLHDAWRWGMAADDVAGLLDPLQAALGWLVGDADADGDGFLEYVDLSGHGLANQGWKDSGDAIQFPDGTIADPPIALSEAQAYAYEAAVSGARLLDAFGRPGANELRSWAADLQARFRSAFWVSDGRGRFPAIALDGAKTPVATATSNIGHLLGTGLLEPDEAASIAARLHEPDLDSGYGLRTMSADAAGFNPLGYHTGTIWPHDTVIAIRGLVADGHSDVAASLASGLLRASPAFDHRLPELFAGTDARADEPVLAYPASCRPQAWAAGVPIALLQAGLGLTADVPGGELKVSPREEFASWFPLRASGLRVAGSPLSITVTAVDEFNVETAAPLAIKGP
jgi:glycogen debranching enzyme